MAFAEIVQDISAALEREGRIAYRMLKRRFDLDDEDIEDLKADLIDAKGVAFDEDGRVLVWGGRSGAAAAAAPTPADRRLLTVMFCDVVDSTALSQRFDAETLRDVIRTYQQICADIIEQYDGHIAQYLGDGLLVYFGYPLAQENEACQAVKAGLDILQALRESAALHEWIGAPMRVRIGINSGPVVVGEMGGSQRTEHLALGDTPNIAARVQSTARPDELLITESTYRLVEGLFTVEALGAQDLKGVSHKMDLFRVIAERASESPFEVALSTGRLTRFVGRSAELDLLRQDWEQTKHRKGQVIVLSAEPGMGKSRLAQEFREQVVAESSRRLTIRCSPYHGASPLFPIIQVCRHVFSFAADDTPATKRLKVERHLADYAFNDRDAVELVCELLSLPAAGGGAAHTGFTQARRERLFDVLIEWFVQESGERPVLAIWDDLQWADPSTLELLDEFLERVPTSATLAILVYRSDYTPAWKQRGFYHRLSLTRLSDPQIEELVDDIADHVTVPAAVVEHVKEKTDGIPLFVEELTRSIVGSGLLERLATEDESAAFDPIGVPMTLQDSFEARLDRCPAGKSIAQFGAMIGREFDYDVLRAVVGDDARVKAGITELLDAELIYRSGSAGAPTFIFKHALLRDTAYESILLRRRRAYHEQIAATLAEDFPAITSVQPEIVAQHYTAAERFDDAAEYWYRAGRLASRQSADQEAVAHLQQGLRLLESMPRTPERARRELAIQLLLGTLVISSQGNAAPAVEATYRRAIAVCEEIGEDCDSTPAYFGLRSYYLTTGDLAKAHEVSLMLLEAATREQRADTVIEANVALATTYYFIGDADAVVRHAAAADALYDIEAHGEHSLLYGVDPGVIANIRLGEVAAWRGETARMTMRFERALTIASSINHPYTNCFAHSQISWVCFWMRDYARAREMSEVVAGLAGEYGYQYYLAAMRVASGAIAAITGDDAAHGLEEIRSGIAMVDTARSHLMYPLTLGIQADALGAAGNAQQALLIVPDALARAASTGAHYCEPYLYCVKGRLLAAANLKADAALAYEHAGTLARERGLAGHELQAALGSARLGASATAAENLRRVLERLGPDAVSEDVRDAQALLRERA